MSKQQIVNPAKRTHFVMLPNLIDDADLDPYEVRLLMHYYRVGNCYEATRTTAKKCKMSVGKISEARRILEEKGWVKIEERNSTSLLITVIDRWAENEEFYDKGRSPDEHSVHHMNANGVECSPHEQGVHHMNQRILIKNNQKIKKNTSSEATASGKPSKKDQDALRKRAQDYFHGLTKLPLPPNKGEQTSQWFAPIREFCELAEWKPELIQKLIREGVQRNKDAKLSIFSPKSIQKNVRAVYAELSQNEDFEEVVARNKQLARDAMGQ